MRRSGFLFAFLVLVSLGISVGTVTLGYFRREQASADVPPFLPFLLSGTSIFFGLLSLLLLGASLISLRHRSMPETARVIWALLIVFLPVAGPIVYFAVSPGTQR